MSGAALADAEDSAVALRFVTPRAKAPEAARRLVERFGEGQAPRKSASALDALVQRIRAVQCDWEQVDPIDRFDVAWVLWMGAAPVAEHEAFLQNFLTWLEEPQRRFLVARLAIAWGTAFDPVLPSIGVVGAWLAARVTRLPDPWPALSEDFEIFAPAIGPAAFAEAFLASDEAAAPFFARVRLPVPVAKGGLGIEIVAAAAAIVAAHAAQEPRLATRLCDLALHMLADAAARTVAPRRLRALRRALADALLLPWQGQEPPAAVKDRIIALLLRHHGDPRVASATWRDIDPAATAAMRRWLTARTVETYFSLAGKKKSVDRAMLAERRDFWLALIDDIDDAWLLAGPDDRAALGAETPAYGRLGGCRPDQSALLIRIADATVLEASHQANESIWLSGNTFAPALFRRGDEPYWLSTLARSPDFSSAYGDKSGSWQERLALFLTRQFEQTQPR